MTVTLVDEDRRTSEEAAETAAPDRERPTREIFSLDGPWQFRTDANAPWRRAQVPGCWESQFPDLRGWAGSAIYERTFEAPDSFRGRRVLLHFGAVDYFAEVWINGTFVGKHEGGYLPFQFDVANLLTWGEQENTVTVRVTDATPDTDVPLPDGSGKLSFAEVPHGKQSWYTPISGIWQSVWLEALPGLSIEHLRVTPELDTGAVCVHIRLSQPVVGEDWRLRLSTTPPDGGAGVEDVEVAVPNGAREAEARVTVPSRLPWSPEHPHLYGLAAHLLQGDEALDVQETRFGFRKIETREGQIWLNNAPYFVIGALDQAFYPQTIYTPPSTEYLRDQFVKAKEMGLNLMRCHIKVPVPEYLDLCDELGLLLWYEIPSGSLLTARMQERVRQTFEEMLERDCNHPSIVIITIMNESWGIDLSDMEQRDWLSQTFRWAKLRVPDRLIVDNSACIPNFHVVSDLDDYHVYYNVPDQARDFADWVHQFADRNAGSYSGFGDATRHQKEPLLISEFGNWGLPHLDKVEEAEGGRPWWYDTGEGITKPAGVLQRFDQQHLQRAFVDYNALADASQEQEWIALKFQIEEMRRRREVAGYVITEFTDLNWEVNGLLDMARNPKIFHNRLIHLQQQDILIPRTERFAYWPGEVVTVNVELSKFSDRDTGGSRITWKILDKEGSFAVGPTPKVETSHIGELVFTAPEVIGEPEKTALEIVLTDRRGHEVARTYQNLVFAPSFFRTWGAGRTAWIHDPVGVAEDLAERLTAAGFRVVEEPEPDSLAIVTQWDIRTNQFAVDGGRAVLAALHPKSLQIASGLNLRLMDRTMNNWWGDWCSSQTWFSRSDFQHLPDIRKFDFEYSEVVPQRVLAGATPDNVISGLFVGWLRNPGAYAVRLPIGKGAMIATTFDVVKPFHSDPIATLMLLCMFEALR